MGEYLKSWQRKLGVVTLVMACLLAISWARSFAVIDSIRLPLASNSGLRYSAISSMNGTLEIFWYCETRYRSDSTATPPPASPQLGIDVNFQAVGEFIQAKLFTPAVSTITIPAPLFTAPRPIASASAPAGAIIVDITPTAIIPYWLTVIPLTLIAAWLLLSKPHQPTKPDASQKRTA